VVSPFGIRCVFKLAFNGPGAGAVSEFTDKFSYEEQNLDSRKMWFRSTKPLMAFAPCCVPLFFKSME